MTDSRWIGALLEQVAQLFPLLGSLAYMLLVTRWAHACYNRVNQRTHPPSTYEERREYRLYFRLAFFSGLLFVAISIGWWIVAHRQPQYVFQGTIIGLEPSQQLVAVEEGFYHRTVRREVEKGRVVTDYSFSIVRNTPFFSGQTFLLGLYPVAGTVGKARPTPIELAIAYRGVSNDRLTLWRDGERYRLVPAGEGSQ
ncbi:hypothetical protein [Thauera sinica]|uniref:Transmembrane protein n=1 Tax=Thauera sinica TaxID=2665146 RepID=A0ABW1ATL9_9RHOO|nr:hypothetical protein [Thauera sp. K11]ATE59943.1 hypothetical protein CCZ27_08265 [Thauera sp. K11]